MAGAVVLGPVGAVAGAFVGYTAGPSISRSWGLEGSRSSRHRRQSSRDSVRGARAEAAGPATSSAGQAERKRPRHQLSRAEPAALQRRRPSNPSSERTRRLQRYRQPPSCTGTTPTAAAAPRSRVQAASAATLADTLPSSARSIEFCRAPITM